MSKGLQVAPSFSLPIDAVTETFALLATRGAGKTYSAKVIAEEMLKAAQLHVVVLDPMDAWWGLRSSPDGKSPGFEVAIFGGEHADLPLEPTAGKFIADLVVDERLSAIICVAEFSKSKRKEFVADFLERLYHRNREAMHLFVEEADMFAPQKPRSGEERMLGAMEDIVRRGRGRGIGTTLITQRNAVINKDVIEMTSNLIAMRTMGINDRKTVDAWLDAHGTAEERKEIVRSLPSLKTGEAYFYSPHFLGRMERLRFRKAETFDSSATPKPGQSKRVPKTVADVDLGALKEAMAATIERAQAEDPKHLRKRIADLQRELRTRAAEPTKIEVPVEVPILQDDVVERLEKAVVGLRDIASEVMDGLKLLPSGSAGHRPQPPPPEPRKAAPVRVRRTAPSPNEGETEGLNASAHKILGALAVYPNGLTSVQLGLVTGLIARGGSWNRTMLTLRSLDCISQRGEKLFITPTGTELAADVPEYPPTLEEIVAMWQGRLPSAAAGVLGLLVEAYPDSLTKEELGDSLGLKPYGGSWNRAMKALRGSGAAVMSGPNGMQASEALMALGGHP